MVEHGVQWFNKEYLLPLLVPSKEYLDPESYTKDITLGPKLPELRLSPKGEAEYPQYVLASGQHRVHALVEHRQALREGIEELRTQEKAEKLTSEELPRITEALSRQTAQLELAKYWGVVIYDESKSHRHAP